MESAAAGRGVRLCFFFSVLTERGVQAMKAAKVDAPVGKGKTATEAVDEDKLYDFNYDEQMKVREGRPWKKEPKYFKKVKISDVALVKMVGQQRARARAAHLFSPPSLGDARRVGRAAGGDGHPAGQD